MSAPKMSLILKIAARNTFFAGWLIAGACAPIGSENSKLLIPTPKESSSGILVQSPSQEQIESLKHINGITVQNIGNHLIKVQGENLDKASSILKGTEILPNAYEPNLFKNATRFQTPSELLNTFSKFEDLNENPEKGNKLNLKECITVSKGIGSTRPTIGFVANPKLKVSIKSNLKLVNFYGITEVNKSQPVNFEFEVTSDSKPVDTPQLIWLIQGPASSSYNEKSGGSGKLNFSPDVRGAYILSVYAKDSSPGCNYSQYLFGATENADFDLEGDKKFPTPVLKALFKHLDAVSATKAWEVTKGDGVTIAIIDSGINYNHPDLKQNVFTNLKEIPDNGIDDDKNGYVDDIHGWDFAFNDNKPYDDDGHGTHVSALAASGLTGIAPNSKILPLKVGDPVGGGDAASVFAAIYYAVDNGADIINMSLGSSHKAFEKTLEKAVKYAEEKGVLIVAAAGNGDSYGNGMNLDNAPHFPASLANSNIISVASTVMSKRDLTVYSNYGIKSVDLASPGGSKLSGGPIISANHLVENSLYSAKVGTSMASPIVAGAAALLKSLNKNMTYSEVKEILFNTADLKVSLFTKISTGGVLNVLSAVQSVRPEIEEDPDDRTTLASTDN